jgi:hypothetical protein
VAEGPQGFFGTSQRRVSCGSGTISTKWTLTEKGNRYLKAAGRVVMMPRAAGDETASVRRAGCGLLERTPVRRRIGVVKLLRARGGCLGVIGRKRAWKAAKSPGERPNARRARNARTHAGN